MKLEENFIYYNYTIYCNIFSINYNIQPNNMYTFVLTVDVKSAMIDYRMYRMLTLSVVYILNLRLST